MINLKTANTLGIKLTDNLLSLADEVIEESCSLLQCMSSVMADVVYKVADEGRAGLYRLL